MSKTAESARLPEADKKRLRRLTEYKGGSIRTLTVGHVLLSQDGVMLEAVAKELGVPFDPREYADAIIHPDRRIVWI